MVNLMGCQGSEDQAIASLRAQFADSASTGTYFAADNFTKAETLYNAAVTTSNQLCAI
jgi:hypothetical protein